uniref:MRP-L46 domain-containing protein n=1 Tax=Parastrongyloides trichosuri TaxID=131310 RepID=A0A0N4ZNL2_PARTI
MKIFTPHYTSFGRRLLTEICTKNILGDKTTRSEIIASVVLIRPPLSAPRLSDIEEKYKQKQMEIEARNSLKSDFELQMEKDEKLLAKKRELEEQGKDLSELEGEIGITAAMKEDEWMKNAKVIKNKFVQIDDNEIRGNYKNLYRHPETNLILSVKQKFGSSYVSPWMLPQTNDVQNSLRGALEIAINEMFNGTIKMKMMGGAPFSYNKYKYPKKLRESRDIDYGEFFFFGAVLKDPSADIEVNDQLIADYQWLTAEEIDKKMKGKQYIKAAKMCIHQ